MKRIVAIIAVVLGVSALASFPKGGRFNASEDLPSGALVYVEINDLPAFVKLWEKSGLRRKYLGSDNFRELANRRLGRRLASRWQEFSKGLGSPVDLKFVSRVAEKRAAVAIYDVGKLDFVFIAPVSGLFLKTSILFANKDRFEEKVTGKGVSVLTTAFYTDNGRRRQKLLLTHTSGRLVLATTEGLLLRTIDNIRGRSRGRRLIDERSFKVLASGRSKYPLNVWVDQSRLNRDYYFRRYWLYKGRDALRGIRSGIFSFEIDDEKATEHRTFLVRRRRRSSTVSPRDLKTLRAFAPTNAQFLRFRRTSGRSTAAAIIRSVFEKRGPEPLKKKGFRSWENAYFDPYDYDYGGYRYYGRNFEISIDEPEERLSVRKANRLRILSRKLERLLRRLRPRAMLTVTDSESMAFPLFAEFRRAGVIISARRINGRRFEDAVYKIASEQVGVAGLDLKLSWKTKRNGSQEWRELKLPMIGRKFCYQRKGNALIFSNSADLMADMLKNRGSDSDGLVPVGAFGEYTIINLKSGRKEFEDIFGRLNPKSADDDLFKGNIAGLLSVFSDIGKVRIERKAVSRLLKETITFELAPDK